MRTDVKVGVICVFALALAVVGYFVFHDSKTSKDIIANDATVHPSGTPVGGANSLSITPPTTAPSVASSDAPAATPALASGSPFGPTPAFGQTPSNNSSSYGGPIIGQPSATTAPGVSTTPLPGSSSSPLGPGSSSLTPPDSIHSPLVPSGIAPTTSSSTSLLPPPGGPSNVLGPGGSSPNSAPSDLTITPTPSRRSSLDIGTPSRSNSSNGGTTIDLLGGTGSGTSAPGTYTIAKGDTFGAIAKKNGLTTKAIIAANPGVNPNRLKIGQKIKLPESGTSSVGSGLSTETPTIDGATTKPAKSKSKRGVKSGVTKGAAPKASKAGGSYTIRKGDTLRKIARAVYGDESLWRRIFRLNRGDLSSPSDLKVGQVIRLPK